MHAHGLRRTPQTRLAEARSRPLALALAPSTRHVPCDSGASRSPLATSAALESTVENRLRHPPRAPRRGPPDRLREGARARPSADDRRHRRPTGRHGLAGRRGVLPGRRRAAPHVGRALVGGHGGGARRFPGGGALQLVRREVGDGSKHPRARGPRGHPRRGAQRRLPIGVRRRSRARPRGWPRARRPDGDGPPALAAARTKVRRAIRRRRAPARPKRARALEGTMRNGATGPWMDIDASQVDRFDNPTRLFYMRASRVGVPFEALHLYEAGTATMHVRAAFALDVVNARGPVMNRSETVTFFNDMCILAPASLVDANVRWRDRRAARPRHVHERRDRDRGRPLVRRRRGPRELHVERSCGVGRRRDLARAPMVDPGARLSRLRRYPRAASRAEAAWSEPGGDFVYARFELVNLALNVGGAQQSPRAGASRSAGASRVTAAAGWSTASPASARRSRRTRAARGGRR